MNKKNVFTRFALILTVLVMSVSGAISVSAFEIIDSEDPDNIDHVIHIINKTRTTITMERSVYSYTGSEIKPKVTVKYDLGKSGNTNIVTLKENEDYTLSYSNNVEIGTATIKVTGINGYISSVTTNFSIVERFVPANVTGFKLVSTTSNSVEVAWNKVNNAEGYILYYYDSAAGKWVRALKTKGTTGTVTKLKAATSYKFAVRAFVVDNGTESASAGYPTVTAMTNLPDVTGFNAAATSNTMVKLTWNKVSGAEGYIIYRYDPDKKTWARVAKTTNTNNAYFVTGLKAATTYKFAVKAYRTENKKELFSAKFPVVTTSTTPVSVNFKLTAGSKKATVAWSKMSGVSGYIVYYKTSANGSWQRLKITTGTSYTKTGLVSGRTYYFTVRAYRTVAGKHHYDTFTTKAVKVK